MTPLHDVRAMVLARCAVATPVRVARADAADCIVAHDVVATEQVPPFANTAPNLTAALISISQVRRLQTQSLLTACHYKLATQLICK